jgi:hypothetical protein
MENHGFHMFCSYFIGNMCVSNETIARTFEIHLEIQHFGALELPAPEWFTSSKGSIKKLATWRSGAPRLRTAHFLKEFY